MVQAIERAFRAPVISAYGSREVGAVACQCNVRQGLHLATQSHVVEAIGPDLRPVVEQEGDLVITPLMNYAMWFIRYRIGDHGRLTRKSCACGRPFPLLEALTGRVVEILINSKGEQVDPIYFVQLFAVIFNRGLVRKFQIVQEEDKSITANLVLEPRVAAEEAESEFGEIKSKIRLVMGDDCTVRFAYQADIPLGPSGKYPYVIRRQRKALQPNA